MITNFKLYENKSKYDYEIGDIYYSGIEMQQPNVILGGGEFKSGYFVEIMVYYAYLVREDNINAMKYYIDDNRGKIVTIENEFKNNPEGVATTYEELSNYKDYYSDFDPKIVENSFKPLIKNVQNIWLEKIPEINLYLQSNKYNL